METGRTPCCLAPGSPCGTRFTPLLGWAFRITGKAVTLCTLSDAERGRAPFFAQPVGFDGRAFLLAFDHGCDTEKLLHEVCHWLLAPQKRRGRANYGLGPGPGASAVAEAERDNEEVTVMLLERLLAPHFGLAEERIAKPDYNVANRRNLDWEACAERARLRYEELAAALP